MAEQSLEQLEQEFHQIVSGIHPADVVTKGNAQKKWNSIAKPLHSLGKLEDHIMQIAALTGDTDVNLNRKALIVMCADNGVVEEGVTQTGQEVTAIVAENFLTCNTSAAIPHDGVVWYIFFVLDHIKKPDEFQHTHRFTVHLCFRFDRFQQRLRIFFKHR